MMTAKAAATLSTSMSAKAVVAFATLALSGCGRYADFTLPALNGSASPRVTLKLQPDPVMGPGQWDSSDVLNPSIVARDGRLWNFYSGFDGSVWHTGVATSNDGTHWERRGKVLSAENGRWDRGYIAANGSALWRNGEFWYWYQAGERGSVMRIGLARSPDAVQFHRESQPVLDVGPYQSWDERAVADPYVIETGGWLFMYYLGQDRAARQRIGVARSRNGVSWEKLRSNPILDIADPGTGGMDENGAGEPAVFVWNGHYWMLITGRDAKEHRRLAAFWSNDGIHWTRQQGSFAGDQDWDRAVLCDPTVLVERDRVRVWYGGGDLPKSDERIHGQIGVGVLQ
jgi:predicted GH43/DUF377 family glycosyl hydrolase